MDLDDFRVLLESSGVDIWTFVHTAISVALLDYGDELKERRDEIVERLYSSSISRCKNCDRGCRKETVNLVEKESTPAEKSASPLTPQSIDYDLSFDDEKTKFLAIKERLNDPDESEESLIMLLQNLADTDITFKALQETDIGRDVNRLRKHSSNDVKRLVKQLVRKWKELVDEWVRVNPSGELSSSQSIVAADFDSPQQKIHQNGHHQVPDFAYSPNLHNGNSGADKNNEEPEGKPKAIPIKEPPLIPMQSVPASSYASPNKPRPPKEKSIDEKVKSSGKRIQEMYKEAENVKKQRTIQVMDVHEIPKPKNAFFAKNRGGSQRRNW